jgi:hypothetical protein
MNCNFNPNSCSINCKKYSICSYFFIQNQLSEVQSQLNFIYKTITEILTLSETADSKIKLLESAVFTEKDSYLNTNFCKESQDEKEDR